MVSFTPEQRNAAWSTSRLPAGFSAQVRAPPDFCGRGAGVVLYLDSILVAMRRYLTQVRVAESPRGAGRPQCRRRRFLGDLPPPSCPLAVPCFVLPRQGIKNLDAFILFRILLHCLRALLSPTPI